MKRILVWTFCFLSVVIHATDFEGKIMYQNTYTSKLPQLTDAQLKTLLCDRQEYYYKKGNYKSVPNNGEIEWQMYTNNENKVYLKLKSSEVVLWNDAAAQVDEVLDVQLNRKVTEVLGYVCDELILTCKSGVQKYYFNSALGVDANLFKLHKYGNWLEYISRANALPLKMDIETSQFVIHSVAVDVKQMTLENSVFQLPEGTKTEEKKD